MPRPTRTKKERTQVTTPATAAAPAAAEISVPAAKTSAKALKPRKKPEVKPAFQSSVTALCPYCSHKHELPVEKGKNGKAFILVCDRCNTDFAVRFVAGGSVSGADRRFQIDTYLCYPTIKSCHPAVSSSIDNKHQCAIYFRELSRSASYSAVETGTVCPKF